MLFYTIKRALESKHIDRVIALCDNEETAAICRDVGAETPFIRPSNLSSPFSTVNDLLKYSINKLNEMKYYPDICVVLQKNYPFRPHGFIDDIVEGIVRVHKSPPKEDLNWDSNKGNSSSSSAPYRVLNIGNNNPVKLEDFVEEIEKNLGKKAIKNYLPLQTGDVPETYADTYLLKELTGFTPKVSIKEGIKNFVDWYINFYEIE